MQKNDTHVPALRDCPYLVAELKDAIKCLLTEIALLQHRVMMLEVKNGKM